MLAQIVIDRFLRSEISRQYLLSAHDKLILIFIASHMGPKPQCYPSYKALEVVCSISNASVKRSIKSVGKKGLINILRTNGRNNCYTLNLELLTVPGSDSTGFTQTPVSLRSDHPDHTDLPPGSHRPPNNIINNISECTSVISLQKPPAKTRTPKNKSSFPTGMKIKEAHRALAISLAINVDDQFIHFQEHHLAKGSTFKNWDMAFNTWLRRAGTYAQNRPAPRSGNFGGIVYE